MRAAVGGLRADDFKLVKNQGPTATRKKFLVCAEFAGSYSELTPILTTNW